MAEFIFFEKNNRPFSQLLVLFSAIPAFCPPILSHIRLDLTVGITSVKFWSCMSNSDVSLLVSILEQHLMSTPRLILIFGWTLLFCSYLNVSSFVCDRGMAMQVVTIVCLRRIEL